ncbi:MAG: HAD-IA family hydrolase [Acidimicrobiia bacterium]|nr:HAD-IA family hydrolase [Acidimicrobiia bacterium]MYG60032.1 HAD-IA family hydrolase [Acidimicrobiia bacterium]MYJ32200.1 HAD-IA family hydrolase [Acidimicrobiia bacterium]
MVEAVLFDMGGVIVSGPWEGFAAYERANGLPEGLIRRINSTDPDSNAWARMERGEIGLEEFAGAFEAEAAALGYQVDGMAVLNGLGGEVLPSMAEAVRRCSVRLKTGLLTNNYAPMESSERSAEIAEVLGWFDVVVESSVVGVRKPDPAFYSMACEALDVEPSACVFLDDLGVNLKPARAMGMTTIKVVDPEKALGELEAAVGFSLRG